ncbi:6270_t:CDS:2 [Ambispora gerdemannii]|uniref:6270_t:CDS:1 n=1 Tax=Ambispora gerdemannii TaxID=144530 RepID=A0A9N9CJP0_9GLOM|nr:6270_t:CDS:2 [Ambispora gerdemannii]
MPHNKVTVYLNETPEELETKHLAKRVYIYFTLLIDYISYGINYLISLILNNFFGHPKPSLLHTPTPTFHPVVLVTGTSAGIGRDVALTLARKGYTVFAAVRKVEDFELLLQEFRDITVTNENHGTLNCVLMDVTNCNDRQRAYDTIRHAIGRDTPFVGLLNVAAAIIYLPVEVASDLAIHDTFETNLFGIIHLTKLFLPLLRESRGRVVNIGSMAAWNSTSSMAIYSASKAALRALTHTWRQEVRSMGINMILVEPGMIDTRFTQKVHQDFQEFTGFSNSPYCEKLQNVNLRTLEIYEAQFKIFGKFCDEAIDSAAPPGIVTDAILHALTSRFPKTTYYVGMDSKVLASLNWLLGERISEAIQARIFGF